MVSAPRRHITTGPTSKVVGVSYAKYFRLDEMCKDFKNTGRSFGSEFIGVCQADRWATCRPDADLYMNAVMGCLDDYRHTATPHRQGSQAHRSVLQMGPHFVMRL